jgi:hypothetical protein
MCTSLRLLETFVRSIPLPRVLSVLSYNSTTGAFTWLQSGKPAGHKRADGYLQIRIDGLLLYGQRVAWAFVNGAWPEKVIDHIDGNPANNSYANLREVTQMTNRQNMREAQKSSKSGLLGASPYRNKWRATIYVDKKQKVIGYFATAEEAHHAYIEAKRNLHSGCTI